MTAYAATLTAATRNPGGFLRGPPGRTADGLAAGRDAAHSRIMPEKHPKRPRDLNQWAKHVVDVATGNASDREPTPEEQGKNASAVARGKAGGPKGGRARATKLTAEQRADIARVAAQTRWKKSP